MIGFSFGTDFASYNCFSVRDQIYHQASTQVFPLRMLFLKLQHLMLNRFAISFIVLVLVDHAANSLLLHTSKHL